MDETNNTQNTNAVATPADNKETAPATPSLHKYYWSTDDKPFEPTWVPFEIQDNSYPLVKEAPSPDMKAPKYDWNHRVWNDNVEESVNQKVNQAVDDYKALSKQVGQMQTQMTNSEKQSQTTSRDFQSLQQMVVALGQNIGQQTNLLKQLTEQTAQGNPAKPTTDTAQQGQSQDKANTATADNKEEGNK